MYFDALTLACVADELRGTILGGRLQAAVLPDELSVGLEIYAGRQRYYLLASAHPELGRVLLSSEKLRRGASKETGLLVLLRKYSRGASLTAIEQPPFERILHLEFDHPEWGHSELVLEVMGRHSNIILLGTGNQVLDAVKRVGPQLSAARPILPGQPYRPPPAQSKLLPSELTEQRLEQMLGGAEARKEIWQALVGGLKGMSPLLAREAVFRALGDPRAAADKVEQPALLMEALRELLAPLETGRWQPTVVLEEGRPVAYAPYWIRHRGEAAGVVSMSQAIEQTTAVLAAKLPGASVSGQPWDQPLAGRSEEMVPSDSAPPEAGRRPTVFSTDPYAAARRPVREAIASERARLMRRREALVRSAAEAGEAEQWRLWGEWILAYAHSIDPRQTELVAETGDGEVIVIPLDANASAADNAQAYFARYRKAQRAKAGEAERIGEVQLALQDLEQLETDLELAASRPEIDAVWVTAVEAGYVRGGESRRLPGPAATPLTLTLPDGCTILVGRNSRQNDEVTFRRASADDWWFHAQGVPGSHVIVRSAGRALVPDTIQRAAELAAYFSRLRNEPRVAVDYTRRRHVRRVPGAAPGLVTYSQEQTIRVTPHGQ